MDGLEIPETAELAVLVSRVGGIVLPESDQQIIDLIASAEELKNALAAMQGRLAARLVGIRGEEARAQGHSVRGVRGGVIAEVSLARRISPWQGSRFVAMAERAAAEMPVAFAAFVRGELSEHRLAILLRETRCLTAAERGLVDERLAGTLTGLSDTELTQLVRRECHDLAPESAADRWRLALSDRYVSLRPAPEGMMSLHALIPAEIGQVIACGLAARAGRLRGSGDARSLEQLKADALGEALLAYLAYDEDASGGSAEAVLEVQLLISDMALLGPGRELGPVGVSGVVGSENEPAHLVGYGPVPAPIAREKILAALEADPEKVRLRRLWEEPRTHELVAMESSARTFPKGLGRLIRTRDDTCRQPYCGAPIREVDHVVAHADGGPTTERNGQGLCSGCNKAKANPRWRSVRTADGSVLTQTPTGHRPPAHEPHFAPPPPHPLSDGSGDVNAPESVEQ